MFSKGVPALLYEVMLMKTYGVLVIGALLMGLPAVCAADYVPMKPKSIVQQDMRTGMQCFNAAYEAYFAAKNADSVIARGNFYAQAISNIAKANAMESDNVAYIVLSMQIYRGKGVLPYAKSAVLRAEKLLQDRLALVPDAAGALLDYAILCRAGDMAYRPEQQAYYQKSQQLARQVCVALAQDNSSDALCAKAMANLVLNNKEQFLSLLKAGLKTSGEPGASGFYLNLYENTVAKNSWLWPVAEKYLQNEFLLYYLCDLSRPYSF